MLRLDWLFMSVVHTFSYHKELQAAVAPRSCGTWISSTLPNGIIGTHKLTLRSILRLPGVPLHLSPVCGCLWRGSLLWTGKPSKARAKLSSGCYCHLVTTFPLVNTNLEHYSEDGIRDKRKTRKSMIEVVNAGGTKCSYDYDLKVLLPKVARSPPPRLNTQGSMDPHWLWGWSLQGRACRECPSVRNTWRGCDERTHRGSWFLVSSLAWASSLECHHPSRHIST